MKYLGGPKFEQFRKMKEGLNIPGMGSKTKEAKEAKEAKEPMKAMKAKEEQATTAN